MTIDLLAPENLRKALQYCPQTGLLFWRKKPEWMFATRRAFNTWNTKHAGKRALINKSPNGYLMGRVANSPQYAHRVIWAMVFDCYPAGDVDHINGVRDDNRISNLREVSRSINLRNARRNSRNTSGHNGVSWNTKSQTWRANIKIEGRQTYLGSFETIEAAVEARKAAENGLGFTARHGV